MILNDHISNDEIYNWGINALAKFDLNTSEAEIIISSLVQTSLWGIDSHGIARIPHYLKRIENKTINSHPEIKFKKTGHSTGIIDGDDGHGILIMSKATDKAILLAKESGVGVVGAINSSHCGAIGLYTRQITHSNMIGIAFTHADALVVPFGGNKPFFGTNPISIAFPTSDIERPICLDMATSIVPWNYIMNARIENTQVPHGIGIDIDGLDSTDPHKINAIKPMADYKGYGLAFMVDMFCSVLNGVNFGPNMTSMYKDIDKKRKLGSTVIAIDPTRFGGKESFKIVATEMIKQLKLINSEIKYPGEPEYKSLEKRNIEGIPFSKSLKEEFNLWSRKLNLEELE